MELARFKHWQPPADWIKISTIDAHTEGEPLRIITGGLPEIKGKTILEKRRYFRSKMDEIRKALMWEPRGHADMYGCILLPALSPQADFGVLFTHNEGYSSMCGHGIIAVTKVVLETGLVAMTEPETRLVIDTPAGAVNAFARIQNQHVASVYFQNVPSFVFLQDGIITLPDYGEIRFDIAFGGAFYALVEARDVNLKCTPSHFWQLIDTGMQIKNAVKAKVSIEHPFEQDLSFLYGTIFTEPAHNSDADSRNVCIFAEGEVDRSPTGTGVSARTALHHARGELKVGEVMTIESIIGTRFTGRAIKLTTFGPYQAVIPEVEGRAFITGKNEFYLDPHDPLKNGFILR